MPHVKLKPEEIGAVLARFEQAMAAGFLSTPTPCNVCSHPDLAKINELLLQGATYKKLIELYGFGTDSIGRHYNKHLKQFIDPEISTVGSALGPVAQHESRRRFPINGSAREQYKWCIGQMMVVRQIAINNINNAASEVEWRAVNTYLSAVLKIRDTVALLHDGLGKKAKYRSLEDDIPPEQRKVLEEALKRKQAALKLALKAKREARREKKSGSAHPA